MTSRQNAHTARRRRSVCRDAVTMRLAKGQVLGVLFDILELPKPALARQALRRPKLPTNPT